MALRLVEPDVFGWGGPQQEAEGLVKASRMLDLLTLHTQVTSLSRRSSSRHSFRRNFAPQVFLSLMVLLLTPAAFAEWPDEIGYTALKHRLGSSLPTGNSIQIAQVEMPSGDDTDYLPDRSDPQLIGMTINWMSGAGGVSDHATRVGRYCIGLVSHVQPGRLLIDSYEANNWAGPGLLLINTNQSPKEETRPVQNHSWIGSFGVDCLDTDAIRRMDMVVERDGVFVAAGVKNGANTAVPHLMCSAYNVVAVGVSNGRSSYGPVMLDTTGRSKPDIVAPMTATSWATPVITSSGSLLLEAIESRGDLKTLPAQEAHSIRPLLVKALLMAGASKSPWSDWHRGFAKTVTDGSVPLDYRYGAGQVDIDRSYRILEGGRQNPAWSAVATAGWDCNIASPRGPRQYHIESTVANHRASILLTWYRHISATAGCPLNLKPELANLDLRLFRTTATGAQETVDVSRSSVDNVEHIYLPELSPGHYTIEVTTDRDSKYAVAWDLQPTMNSPAPGSMLVQASAEDIAASPAAVQPEQPDPQPTARGSGQAPSNN